MGIMGLPLHHTPEPVWSDIWGTVRDRLRLEVGQGIFDTWIAPLSLSTAEKGHVRLSAPSRLVRDYAASHHAARIERAFAGAVAQFSALEIVIAPADARPIIAVKTVPLAVLQRGHALPPGAATLTGGGAGKNSGASLQGLWDRQPDPRQTFASLVVGASNGFPFQGAQSFAA